MQPDKRWCLTLLLLFVSLLAACSDTGGAEPAGPTPSPTATAEYYDTAMPTRTPRPTSTPQPTEEPTVTPEATPEEESNITIEGVSSLDAVEFITSYRFRIEVQTEGAAFEAENTETLTARNVVMEGAVVKEPPAQELILSFGDDETSSGFRVVGGQVFTSLNGEWFEATSTDVPTVEEVAPLTAVNITRYLDDLETIGDDEVDGRAAVSHHADQAALVAIAQGQGGDAEELYKNATTAEADIWIDEEGGFISKMDVTVAGTGVNPNAPDLEGQYTVHVEYFDINQEIAIETPEVSGEVASSGGGGSDPGEIETTNQTITDLTKLLGFRIDLPEGSKIEIFFDLASITVPLSLEETRPIFVRAFEANGYTQDTNSTLAQFGAYLYSNDEKQWTLYFTEQDSSTTLVSISPVVQGTPTP